VRYDFTLHREQTLLVSPLLDQVIPNAFARAIVARFTQAPACTPGNTSSSATSNTGCAKDGGRCARPTRFRFSGR
jgi:hypothetical protein